MKCHFLLSNRRHLAAWGHAACSTRRLSLGGAGPVTSPGAHRPLAMFMRVLCLFMIATLATGCAGTKPAATAVKRDAYYHRVMTSGHGAFERGDLGRAAELYLNALTRARIMDRSPEIASAAYNLALTRIALGDTESGLTLLREAREELGRAGESVVDIWLAEAEVHRRAGDPASARAATDEALQSLEGLREHALRVQIHSLRALLALDQGATDEAREAYALARRSVRKDMSLRLLARLEEVNGRMALADGDALMAAQAFEVEALHYRDAGRYADMARALARAGEARAQGGDAVAALDRFYRTARHHAANGEPVDALRWLGRAVQCLDEAPDEAAAARIAGLVEELQKTMKQKAD